MLSAQGRQSRGFEMFGVKSLCALGASGSPRPGAIGGFLGQRAQTQYRSGSAGAGGCNPAGHPTEGICSDRDLFVSAARKTTRRKSRLVYVLAMSSRSSRCR
jgi:hypothetical protein